MKRIPQEQDEDFEVVLDAVLDADAREERSASDAPVITRGQRWVWSLGWGGTGSPRVNLVEGDRIIRLIAGTSRQQLTLPEARLIAAAPDLLLALREMSTAWNFAMLGGAIPPDAESVRIAEQAVLALAKATGEAQS